MTGAQSRPPWTLLSYSTCPHCNLAAHWSLEHHTHQTPVDMQVHGCCCVCGGPIGCLLVPTNSTKLSNESEPDGKNGVHWY